MDGNGLHNLLVVTMLMSFTYIHVTMAFGMDPELGKSACVYLYPSGHEAEPQSTNSPYALVVSSDRYEPGTPLTVTINSAPLDVPFRGFLLQARRMADLSEKVGEFTPSQNTKLNCINEGWGGKTVTHLDSRMKVNEAITWTAPVESVGDIQFRATVVQAMETYWANISSRVITAPSIPVPEYTADETTPHEQTTNTGHTSPQPGLPQSTQTIEIIDLSTCGVTKSCYRYPDRCTDDCLYVVTWARNGSRHVVFEVHGLLSGTEQYVALGLSLDTKMGDDNVTDCMHANGGQSVMIQQSYNLRDVMKNQVQDDPMEGLVADSLRGTYGDGYITCRFIREFSDQIAGDDPLLEKYYFLVAKGPVNNGVKGYHGSSKFISPDAYNLTSSIFVNKGGITGYPLVKAHGILMILAWMVCASVAVLMPRFFKKTWPSQKWAGKDIWFQLHRSLMISTLVLTVAGFVLIFIHVGGYASYSDLPSKAHPPLGIATTVLVIVNPIMAVFRPSPMSSRRPVFNFFHFCVGLAAHILSVATMYIGVFMSKAAMPSWSVKIMGAYVVWHVLIEISLAVEKHCCATTEDTSSYAMKQPDEKDPMARPPQPQQNTRAKTVLAVLHFVGVLFLSLALIIPLASA